MPRGRPRKVPIVEEKKKTAQEIIAEIAHENCGMPGCWSKFHMVEAQEILDRLSQEGFRITND